MIFYIQKGATMRHNVVIFRRRFRLEELSCLRYDINEHWSWDGGICFMGEGRTGELWDYGCIFFGPKVYILDLNGHQCLSAETHGRSFTNSGEAIFSIWAWDPFPETRYSTLPYIIDDSQAFQPAHNLNMKL